jgi:acyl-[acyl-carrier-protein]-phospholipid O-acyltransferase/long-chain-fatty-acid--[acyl-carrier-protein] ligase
VTGAHDFDRNRLLEAAHQLGLPAITVPREVMETLHLPLLGTGKTDYAAVTRLAEQAMAAPPREITPVEPASLVRD